MYKEKTNKELILEILEECSRPNEEDGEKLNIENTKGTVEEKTNEDLFDEIIIEEDEGTEEEKLKKDSHYRMSMKKVITDKRYTWARLNKPGKALLPVMGCYQNKIDRHCNLARKTMAEYVGISAPTVDRGLKSLVHEGMIIKKKGYRTNNYYLTDKARWIDEEGKDRRTTHFRLYRKDIGYWAKLKPCEKAMYLNFLP